MNVRATVAYDGTDFAGFQRQANARTVQGEIEAALRRLLDREVTLLAAGRTDAGVHAMGQVIAFSVEGWRHPLETLMRALNATLPEDIAVRSIQPSPPGFHPRYSALSRMYEYTAYVDPVRRPLQRRNAWHLEHPVDLARMNAAAAILVGEHDFAAFGQPPSGDDEETTVRRVLRAEWRAGDEGEVRFCIEANAFLYKMVRRIVRALVNVGLGKSQPEEVRSLLDSKDPQRLKGIAPACGLCLVKVTYPV
ncbi:MAG: tRNA pseudouridine(38-40) synthase TruA [Anaerolineae bacterium]|nr:tRNA pseudouridine(38-40) synthase TruA [Thermoflexales bacterium]MDW8395543.1 tRNA pseudouridine(38-40) synthase TruA [Anaerolineae bacterium]